jgi:radical SAM protein with 4Fe4S-binding SPASM domain
VTWSLTSRCNLACSYCLDDSVAPNAPIESNPQERQHIVNEIIAARVLKVYLSGGEPLLVDELHEYVAAFRRAGAAVRLTSNGTLVDETVARLLAEAGLSAAEISLQPGTADAVARGVRCLVDAGIRTVLRAVVTRANMAGLEDVVRSFAESGVESISFQEVIPLGRAARDAQSWVMDVDEMQRVREEVQRLRLTWGERFIGLASTTLADQAIGHPLPCTLGQGVWKSCEVQPDGNVIPCTPAAAFGIRNSLHEKGLERCWQDLHELYRTVTPGAPGGVCAACLSRDACRGGCRAICHLLDGPGGGNPACRFHTTTPGDSNRRASESVIGHQ